MKTKNRIFAIFALIFNILIIGAVGYGLFIAFTEAPNKLELLKYFTIDSNFLLGLAALMMIPNNIVKIANPEKPYIHFFKNLKFIAVVSTSITLVTAYAFLGLNGSFGTYLEATIGGTELLVIITSQIFYLHTFAPVLGIVSEIFDKDEKPKYKTVMYGFIPLAIYTVPYVVFAVVPGLKAAYNGDWYLFLSYTLISSNSIANTAVLTLIAVVAEFIVALLFGTIVWALILIGASSKQKQERVTYSYVGPKEEQHETEEVPTEENKNTFLESTEEQSEETVEEEKHEEATEVEETPEPVEEVVEETSEEESVEEPATEEPQESEEEPAPEEAEEPVKEEPQPVEEEKPEEATEETPEQANEETLEPADEKEKRLQAMVKEGLISQEEYDQLMNKPEEDPKEKPTEEKKVWPFQKKKEKKGFAKKAEESKAKESKEEKKPESTKKSSPAKKPAAKKTAPAKKEPAKKAEPKKETKETTNKKSTSKGGTKVAVAKKEAAPAKKPAAKKEEPAKFNGKARVYHISQHENGYKVKLAGGEKAIKTFKTQKEAIAYAKELVKTQGGTYLIHSLDGSIRKG